MHIPIGHRRFKHAIPIYSYDTLVDATQFKAIPPQPFNKLETFFSTTKQKFQLNEDCLHLNIWRQSTGKAKETCNHLLLWWWLYKWSWFSRIIYSRTYC